MTGPESGAVAGLGTSDWCRSCRLGAFEGETQLPKPLSVCLEVLASRIHEWFETPKRPYEEGSVKSAYDEWARDGVLEHYWGEHIHMGSYNPMNKQSGYRKKVPCLQEPS